MGRPRASKTIKRHWTGDDNGVGTVLESCLMQVEYDNGTKLDGEFCIVRMYHGHRGLEYGVTCNGELICLDGELAAFKTLAEAAAFANL